MRRLVAIALGLALATACNDDRDAPASRRDEVHVDRDATIRKLETKLADLDRKLAALKSEAAARGRELGSELDDLRAAVRRELDDARRGSGDWGRVKARVDEALGRLRRGYDEGVAKLRGHRIDMPS